MGYTYDGRQRVVTWCLALDNIARRSMMLVQRAPIVLPALSSGQYGSSRVILTIP